MNAQSENRSTATPRILVAGIGNIFLGDDAFGVEVVQRLARRELPAGVRVVDFGIRGIDLTYALLDDYDLTILVDAMPRGEVPGTLFVLEPEPIAPDPAVLHGIPLMEGHNLDPVKVLSLVAALGGKVRRLLIVGCQPGPSDEQDMRDGLSPAVLAAVDEAIKTIEALISKALEDHHRRLCTTAGPQQSKGAGYVTIS